MRISDWSSDVCSSDLIDLLGQVLLDPLAHHGALLAGNRQHVLLDLTGNFLAEGDIGLAIAGPVGVEGLAQPVLDAVDAERSAERRDGKDGISTCRYRWSPYL